MRAAVDFAVLMLAPMGLIASLSAVKPVSAQDPDTALERDVPYSGELSMDIHAPEGAGPFPVVVTFHGASGGKAAMSELAAALANHGFLVFNAAWLATSRPIDAAAATRSFEEA